MKERAGPFVGVAARPGVITVVLLDAPGRRGPLRFRATAPQVEPTPPAGCAAAAQRIVGAARAARAAVRYVEENVAGARATPCPIAILGYIAQPRQPGALYINELNTLTRLHLAQAELPWFEVTPLWLARFVSDADEARAGVIWARLDAGRAGFPGGAGGYGWAGALAHVARCAVQPARYDPWRRALARELAR